MKVAIVIPGLIRHTDQTYNSFYDNVIKANKDCDVDVYLAFWDKTHIRGGNNTPSSIKEVDPTKILELYNPVDHIILDYDSTQLKFLEKAKFLYSSFPTPYGNVEFFRNAIISQFYTWKQVVNLIPSTKNYDLVLKTRFDLKHTSPINFLELTPSSMSVGDKWGGEEFCDWSFVSTYENMVDVLNQCYDKINQSSFVSSLKKRATPEIILTKIINELNIPIDYNLILYKLIK